MNNENQQTHKGDDILPLPKHEEITSIDKENACQILSQSCKQ